MKLASSRDAFMKRSFRMKLCLSCALLYIVFLGWELNLLRKTGRDNPLPGAVSLDRKLTWPMVNDFSWCRPENTFPGLLYIKIPKTGSSTLAGINVRIAKKTEKKKHESGWKLPFKSGPRCSYSYKHGKLSEFQDRRDPHLLWSFVRDPAARAVSSFYHFKVSREGFRATDVIFTSFLKTQRNFQVEYLADHHKPSEMLGQASPGEAVQNIIQKHILDPYHFVGVSERRFESYAVMKLLWGLDSRDLIVLSAKTTGGYDDGRFENRCIQILQPPTNHSMAVEKYRSTGFVQDNADFALYDSVNHMLDKTIELLGRYNVNHEVEILQELQRIAERECRSKAIFPCSPNGTLQIEASLKNCYASDSGCGYACIDEVL